MGRVVVVGSINQDVVTSVARHPRPGETVAGLDLVYLPGGKGANQAVAAALGGAKTSMVGRVGDDAFAAGLVAFLQEKNVDCSQVVPESGVASGTAIIAVDESGENTIVVNAGANARLLDASDVDLTGSEVVVSQFEIPMPQFCLCSRELMLPGA